MDNMRRNTSRLRELTVSLKQIPHAYSHKELDSAKYLNEFGAGLPRSLQKRIQAHRHLYFLHVRH